MGDPYVVPAYDPPASLNILHNSVRLFGGNEFSVPDEQVSLDLEDESVAYVAGVIAGPAFMLVFFVVWLFALCCVGCCRRKCSCGNKVGVILFLVSMLLSIFGWFYSIGSNATATGGVDKLLNTGDTLTEFLERAEGTINEGLDFVQDTADLIVAAATPCGLILNATNDTFPTSDLGDFTDGIDIGLSNVTDQFTDITSEFQNTVDQIKPYLTQWQTAYTILIACIITLSAVFMLATVWRVAEWAPGSDSKVAGCLGKSSSWIFFTLGILLLLLIWIVIFITASVSTIAADFCVPNPSANLNRVLDELTAADRAAGVDFCDEPPFSYLCYYQTCVGTPPVSADLVPTEQLTSDLETAITDILDEVNSTIQSFNLTIPEANACISALQAVGTEIGGIPAQIQSAIDIVDCPEINPLYRGVVEQGLCDGVAAGLAAMWISLCLGATGLMVALYIYRLLEFDRYENGELVTAQVVSYNDSKQ